MGKERISSARNWLGQSAFVAALIGAGITGIGISSNYSKTPQPRRAERTEGMQEEFRDKIRDIMSFVRGKTPHWDERGHNYQAYHREAERLFEEWEQGSDNPSEQNKEDAICCAAWRAIMMHTYRDTPSNHGRKYDVELAREILEAANPVLLARSRANITPEQQSGISPYQKMLEKYPAILNRIHSSTHRPDDPGFTPYPPGFQDGVSDDTLMMPIWLHEAAGLPLPRDTQGEIMLLRRECAAIENRVITGIDDEERKASLGRDVEESLRHFGAMSEAGKRVQQ